MQGHSGRLTEEERQAILDRVEKKAAAYMYKYGGCGQCVLLALQEEFELPGGRDVIKAAGFVNLGVATMGSTCGALVGGVMAMGLACGRSDWNDSKYPQPEIVEEIYQMPQSMMTVRGFYQKFVQELGSPNCRDLQIRIFGRNFDLCILEEEERFELAGGHRKCVELVGKAARLAADAILDLPRR